MLVFGTTTLDSKVKGFWVLEYDTFLEEHKIELEEKKLMNNTDIIEVRKLEKELDQSDQEVSWIIWMSYYMMVKDKK